MRVVAALLVSCGILSACVSTSPPEKGAVLNANFDTYWASCMFEVDAPGAYIQNGTDPTVKPGRSGTALGATALNACIRAKEAAGNAAPAASATPRKAVVETQSATGTPTIQTYTYGTPPRAHNAKPIPATATPMLSPPPAQSCSYAMTGGTGYTCDRSLLLRRN